MIDPAFTAELDQMQAQCTEWVDVMITETRRAIANTTDDPAELPGRLTLEFMRAGPFVSAGVAGICIARLATMQYEYGIRDKQTGNMHRRGYTAEQADDFMNKTMWGPVNPHHHFEIVRRPVGEWETT